ncbi:MAG: hypothetical protein VYC17_03985, partial [Nitrospinota bacterium]|nr:hypothetical protein [Nitrospinota bacterium]
MFCLVPGVAAADPGVPPRFNNNPVVGSVDGDPIRLDDLKTSRIHDAMVQLYKMQGDGLKRKAV